MKVSQRSLICVAQAPLVISGKATTRTPFSTCEDLHELQTSLHWLSCLKLEEKWKTLKVTIIYLGKIKHLSFSGVECVIEGLACFVAFYFQGV